MSQKKGNALIGQAGGPTAVINQSLVGVVEACLLASEIGSVFGAIRGVQGILDEDLINLGLESPADLESVAKTPCAALRSVRKKPTPEQCGRILDVMQAHDVRYFFYIGGNDSAETAQLLQLAARERNYDLRLFHVPKTIDNDLMVTDHCPGYASAAKFVAQAFLGDNEDNRSLGGVKINVVMGRHAGWLTAASALARGKYGSSPHLIYLPERNFSIAAFQDHVAAAIERHGRCVVAVSEGIHDENGEFILKSDSKDAHGNVQLSGTGALGDLLSEKVRERLGEGHRIRADTFGYLQRSFFGVYSRQDAIEAREVGRHAVRVAVEGKVTSGSLTILRANETGPYEAQYGVTELANVAQKTRVMPEEFLLGDHDVSPAFLRYLEPLVGDLPKIGRLENLPVPRLLS
ncbi:MAG: 6-phosphofructokinase [Planctomycetes bacterium]|nr:6-phosphofructokinase [Planctomycetota bacterium]